MFSVPLDSPADNEAVSDVSMGVAGMGNEPEHAGHDSDDEREAEDEDLIEQPEVFASSCDQEAGRKRKLVSRRTRKVGEKLRGRNPPRRNAAPPPRVEHDTLPRHLSADASHPPNAAPGDNRNLRYLQTQLRDCQTNTERAQCFSRYLDGCSFNTSETPSGIIEFSDDEAVLLSRYVAEVIAEENEVTPPVSKHYIESKLMKYVNC